MRHSVLLAASWTVLGLSLGQLRIPLLGRHPLIYKNAGGLPEKMEVEPD